MAFDTEYYNMIKRFSDEQINHIDFRLVEKYQGKPWKWAKTFTRLVSDCVAREDWEGAKAVSDSIRDFLNRFLPEGEKISENAQLKLPEVEQVKIQGIICFIDGTAKPISN